jgi:hypothetical protein
MALAGAYGAVKTYERFKYSHHNRVLKHAGKNLHSEGEESATITVDHLDPSYAEPGQPKPMGGKIPDLVLRDFPTFVVAEVETADTLDGEAKVQLEAFQKDNYETVLVVPKNDVAEAEAFVEEHVTGEVTVSTACTIADDVL